MSIDEKAIEINTLLEMKNVNVFDDYFHDIFKNENNKEIFRVKSPRFIDNLEESESVMDEIILKLNQYENEVFQSN